VLASLPSFLVDEECSHKLFVVELKELKETLAGKNHRSI